MNEFYFVFLVITGLIEICMVSYVYGLSRFVSDVREMLGKPPSKFWKFLGYPVSRYFKFCWAFVTPVVLAASFLFMLITFVPSEYNGYQYPVWADAIGG